MQWQKKEKLGLKTYEPTVSVTTKKLNERGGP